MDELNQAIAKYKPAIDDAIEKFCQVSLADMRSKYGDNLAHIFDAFLAVLRRGGKHFRGALAIYSYELFGGKDHRISRQIGLVMELLQTYLLVIDDVIDQSDLRRGGPAAHKLIERMHIAQKLFGDPGHFGHSQVICSGVIGQNLAYDILAKLPVDDSVRLSALAFINDIMIKTNIGQIMDVNNEAWRTDEEAEILKTLQQKTAYYSFFMPMKLGAVVSGQDAKFIEPYAMNIGLAFQLYDDIFGTFGDEAKTGKSAKSDIVEGKRTILVSYALTNSSAANRKTLEKALGNSKLTDNDFAKVLDILRSSGALDYTRELAAHYAALAKQALDLAPKSFEHQLGMLNIITQYKV